MHLLDDFLSLIADIALFTPGKPMTKRGRIIWGIMVAFVVVAIGGLAALDAWNVL